jgi:hypothetical protein
LVFGSYTCPQLRGAAEELKRIAAEYEGRVEFRLVYIREAHAQSSDAGDWQSSINSKDGIAMGSARTLAEKREHAALCVRRLNLPFPAVVDRMDDDAAIAYQAWPSRLYLVGRDGKVMFQTRLGELDFHPAELESAIRRTLVTRGDRESLR